MTRLMLHIGTHKTGTTALQDFLWDNADRLEEQGVRYPKPAVKYKSIALSRNGHVLLRHAMECVAPERESRERQSATAENRDALRREAAEHDCLIMSDERIWYEAALHEGFWDALKGLFVDLEIDEVDVYLYLRRQDRLAISLWNQFVKGKTKMTKSLADYVRDRGVQKVLDYDAGLRAVEEAFGRDRVHVRAYVREMLEGHDIRRDFCSFAGLRIDEEWVFRASESNPSLNVNASELKRIANGLDTYGATDNFLQQAAVEASLLSSAHATPALPPDLLEELGGRYGSGNLRIEAEYLGASGELLFEGVPDGGLGALRDIDSFTMDFMRMVFSALSSEHEQRMALERKAKALERKASSLERRVASLERRADGLNASLGPIARLRRKLWRRRSSEDGM